MHKTFPLMNRPTLHDALLVHLLVCHGNTSTWLLPLLDLNVKQST
jgi:hypothetical protein